MSQFAGKTESGPGAEPQEELVLRVPEGALIPEGATFYEGEDDMRCRVIRADGTRCAATRTRATGLCPGHGAPSGIMLDPVAASRRGAAAKRERRERRLTLGITARRAASPVQMARYKAQERAEALAAALVDGPLDDPELGSVARQQAAVRALELLYPQTTATLELELPDSSDGVSSMGWEDMQRLAARVLDGDATEVPPILEAQ